MKQYTEKDLVSFGLYLLSKERKNSFKKHPVMGSKNIADRLADVHHADVENWKEAKKS